MWFLSGDTSKDALPPDLKSLTLKNEKTRDSCISSQNII
jgi:hypothetical protein